MNYRHMEIFLTVVEENSLSRAAEKLFISQPAVTQVIRKLEEEFGGKLFIYNGKNKELSPLGKTCVVSFQNILNQYKGLQNAARELTKGTFGSLTVYMPLRRAQILLPRILPEFAKKYPNVRVKTVDGKARIEYMFTQMIDGKIDMVVSLNRVIDPRITFIPFCVETMSYVASLNNPLAQKLIASGRSSVTIEELFDEKLVLPGSIYWNRQLVDQMFAEYNRYPNSILEVQTVELSKSLAISNFASTIIPELLEKNAPTIHSDQNYVVLPIDNHLAKRPISIGYIGERGLTNYQRDFIDMMKNIGIITE